MSIKGPKTEMSTHTKKEGDSPNVKSQRKHMKMGRKVREEAKRINGITCIGSHKQLTLHKRWLPSLSIATHSPRHKISEMFSLGLNLREHDHSTLKNRPNEVI